MGRVADDRPAQANGVDRLLVFDTDHFGAEIGQDASGGWPRDDPGEVADADAGERESGHAGILRPRAQQ